MGGCSSSKNYHEDEFLSRSGSLKHLQSMKEDRSLDAIKLIEAEEEEKRMLLQMEAEFQLDLRNKSLPMIERTLSTDNLSSTEILEFQKVEAQEEMLLKKEKRKSIMSSASYENKWLVFNSPDLFHKEEITLLSNFINKITNLVPANFWDDQESLYYIDVSRETSVQSIITLSRENSTSSIEGTISISRRRSSENLIKIDKVAVKNDRFKFLPGNIQYFKLPSGFITEKVASDVIELFRQGGTLARSSVHKLLRHAYRRLKTLPNTTYVRLENDEKINIVGDIHG